MKPLIAFILLALSLTGATPKQPLDIWIATDPNTRSITRIEFSSNRSRVRIRTSCSPNDCDWGMVAVRDGDPQGVNSPGEGHPYFVVVNQSVARRSIRFVDYGYTMDYFMTSVFRDKRPDQEIQGKLKVLR